MDPTKRLSATEALQHEWITRKGHTDEHRQHLGGAHDNLKENFTNRADDPSSGGGLNVYRRASNYVKNLGHSTNSK